jgi:hypothetical protein
MKQIIILPPGSPLQEGTRYVDLADPPAQRVYSDRWYGS